MRIIRWACGVTTVESRAGTLQETLAALRLGGFDPAVYTERGLGPYGTYVMCLVETALRQPNADYYAVFQDDVLCYRNLAKYIGKRPCPDDGYMNLYTAQGNEQVVAGKGAGWYEAGLLGNGDGTCHLGRVGNTGRGALGLVYPRAALLALFSGLPSVYELADHPKCVTTGRRRIDGTIVTAMNKVGYREYVHSPSLVQHRDETSTILAIRRLPKAETWRGSGYDALELLQ